MGKAKRKMRPQPPFWWTLIMTTAGSVRIEIIAEDAGY